MKLEERILRIERLNNGFRVMPFIDQHSALGATAPMDNVYVYESIDKLAAALRAWDKNILHARDGKPEEKK